VTGVQTCALPILENKLYLHPAVLRAAVVGIPDHMFSERLKAVLVLKPGQSVTEQQVREHCGALLAHYEVPEYVVFAQTMPTNAAGKTLKQPLVDFWGDTDGSVPARFAAYCASMPPALMDVAHLKVDGAPMTPRDALREIGQRSATGQRIAAIVEERGIVELTKPNEARFRK